VPHNLVAYAAIHHKPDHNTCVLKHRLVMITDDHGSKLSAAFRRNMILALVTCSAGCLNSGVNLIDCSLIVKEQNLSSGF
jgi:hypothetical protein